MPGVRSLTPADEANCLGLFSARLTENINDVEAIGVMGGDFIVANGVVAGDGGGAAGFSGSSGGGILANSSGGSKSLASGSPAIMLSASCGSSSSRRYLTT